MPSLVNSQKYFDKRLLSFDKLTYIYAEDLLEVSWLDVLLLGVLKK